MFQSSGTSQSVQHITAASELSAPGSLFVPCRFVWWAGCPLALAAASYSAFGVNGLIMLLGQAAGSVLLLEVVRAVPEDQVQQRWH